MRKPLILAAILIVSDQFTKYLADKLVPYGEFVNVIPFYNFFNITNVRNTGAAFSMFQGKNFFFIIFIAVFLSAIAVWLYKNRLKISKIQTYAFVLIIAGGFGNLIDRVLRGSVVDFLDFGINSLRWPSFNVADSCVCAAAALIFIELLKKNKR
ncbi:MAG: signal peptidase II [Endomicrobium sp.]|jgi:signal peptidase II|nr:signal peptidase II [Endomicrobium sp.]